MGNVNSVMNQNTGQVANLDKFKEWITAGVDKVIPEMLRIVSAEISNQLDSVVPQNVRTEMLS